MKLSRTAILIIGVFIGANLAAFTLSAQAEPGKAGPFTWYESNIVMRIWGNITIVPGTGVIGEGDVVGAFVETVEVNDGCIGGFTIAKENIDDPPITGDYGMMNLYGDDPNTSKKDGAAEGDTIIFKYYSKSLNRVFDVPGVTTTFLANGTRQVNFSDISLPVVLSTFEAYYVPEGIQLNWTAATQVDNIGWHIYRAESKNGNYQPITKTLIAGAGNSATIKYSYLDENVVAGKTYYYYLEDIDIAGNKNQSLKIRVTVKRHKLLTKTWGAIKSR